MTDRMLGACLRLMPAAVVVLLAACGSSSPVGNAVSGAIPDPQPSIDSQVGLLLDAGRCDPLDSHHCMFPWPNDFFTVEDEATDTGRRVAISALAMPRNVLGKPIDPAEWNRNDGFSPGQKILARVPGLDMARTGAVPLTDIGDSLRRDQPIVVIDADTLERQLIWSELDANITKFTACDVPNPVAVLTGLVGLEQIQPLLTTLGQICEALPLPDDVLRDPGPALIIRPAVNFKEGHRYIVALRNLKNAEGEVIEAEPVFRVFRDNHVSDRAVLNERRPHMEALFAKLAKAGIERQSLYLAWDFTVASERSLSERVLHLRDETFGELGNGVPEYSVTTVTDFTPEQDDLIAREVQGELTVPSYLTLNNGAPGSRFFYTASGPDRLPARNGTMTAPFTCKIPRVAFGNAQTPAAATESRQVRPSLYGHGLLGGQGEVGAGNVRAMAQEHGVMFCALDWIGMSNNDVLNVATILLDISNFPTLVDRAQQGFLNFMMMGRLMIHPQGLCANEAFRLGEQCLIDRQELFYDGNSQGGIMGGALVAVSPDIRAGVLGVPGMNYSTLLRRSVDFDTYAAFMYASYQSSLDQSLALSLMQMLWDRGETNGYAQHLRADDPLPNTTPKRVLLHVAYGDHQVSMTTAEVQARTIGASILCPAVVGGPSPQRGDKVQRSVNPAVASETAAFPELSFGRRHPDDEPYYGIPCIKSYPHRGSALVIWDGGPLNNADGSPNESGVAPPPVTNTPPRPDLGYGVDPHSFPRSTPAARVQKSEFLKPAGAVVNPCGGHPCAARDFDTSR